ncbi:hypothetical protein HWV07_04660 [Natronomonas salina]|nr:hypothetical protein [Natronomonas salina]QLD88360.1 hypothetical protein HWV07_04660 [Natronomonas salina]
MLVLLLLGLLERLLGLLLCLSRWSSNPWWIPCSAICSVLRTASSTVSM